MPEEIQGGEVAPVVEAQVTETPAAEVKPESSQEPTDETPAEGTEPEAGEKEPPAEKTFTQAELDAILEKKTAKVARQRDQERQKRELIEREVAKASIPHDEGKPDISQFTDADEYANAVADWRLGLRDRQEKVAQEHKKVATFDSKAADLRADLEETEGFEVAKWDKLPISDAMALAIVDSELSTKLAHHLYGHPSEAERIFALSPARQAAEIGKLEERLSTAPKTSKAPAPINPIGNGKTVTTKSSSAARTMDEYIERRKAEGARWAR
jgi:hypothetical protein